MEVARGASLFAAAALLVMMFRAHRVSSAARSTWIVVLVSIAVPSAYLSWFNPLQIGIRYALPVIPLLILLSASVITSLGSRSAIAFLVLVSAVGLYEVRGSWPEMLGYYNRTSGGAALAWHRFADSNSDWGHLRTRGLEVLRERHGSGFEVLAKCDGPRLGRIAIDVDAIAIQACSQDAHDAARYRDCAVALLGAGMRIEAARAIEATEGVARVQLEALWQLTESAVESDLAQALECSKLWSTFERHDLAARVMQAPAFADAIDARQRLVEICVQQQDRTAAIATLRAGMHRFPPELHPALELRIAEFEQLFAFGQRYLLGIR